MVTESEVRLYCRTFPAVFSHARGASLFAADGTAYVDFFCGAGALNYGHNPPRIRDALIEHLHSGAVVHALDMDTPVKAAFLRRFDEVVLAPRGLDHRVQFCGPTGADAVEAALKLARKVTGRSGVAAFSGGFHGMTAGALAVSESRAGAGRFVPFGDLDALSRVFADDLPAAVIVEPLQLEGGVRPAPAAWLRELAALCRRHGVLLICDEIQCGVGRTGTFFCFEQAGIVPDLVCLSKSISGFGLPLALVLIRPSLDVWEPGEHTGTFRANQLALVAATAALSFWEDPAFLARVEHVAARLAAVEAPVTRGSGAVLGIELDPAHAALVQHRAFADGVLVERCGPFDEVLKVMPPLTVDDDTLDRGLAILARALDRRVALRA
ncbi:diaminobutyrate--2-oxoglutarate transaminase [Solirubrobacter soli]|uniref:diaminobutyrate--2-oxoglutarate transaminase n=1 Tax=Solirubrobacter soli TaxID=363832 RepID=UPI0003F8D94D|nr:diaminobutyrate--2-oxoglutarate transaminase [Solirubrobacter soli]